MASDPFEQESEMQSVNDTVDIAASNNKKQRRRLWIALTVAVVMVLSTFLIVRFYVKSEAQDGSPKYLTLQHAVAIMPTVIITGEEYALAAALLQDDAVLTLLETGTPSVELDETVTAKYADQIHFDEESIISISITVAQNQVYFDYTTSENNRYILGFSSSVSIIKTAAHYNKSMQAQFVLENTDNLIFRYYKF